MKRRLAVVLAALAVKFGSPLLYAVSWRLRLRRLGQRSSVGRRRVLAVSRRIAKEDFAAIAEQFHDAEIWMLPKPCLRPLFQHCFDQCADRNELTEWNYHNSKVCRPGREAYRSVLGRIFVWWRRFGFEFDAVLTGNVGYPIEQELLLEAQTSGSKVFVLYKEGMAIPGRWKEDEAMVRNDRKHFWDFMLFYNESIRKTIMSSAWPQHMERSVAVGIPRLDRYFELGEPTDRKQVLLFSCDPKEKFEYFDAPDARIKEAIARADEFHRNVICLADAFPDTDFVIKTKAPQRYLDYLDDLVAGMKDPDLSNRKNLRITNDSTAFELISESFAVFGFATTTLIEAIIAGREVIIPDFGDLFDGPTDYFCEHRSLVHYANSYSAMADALRSARDCENLRVTEGGHKRSFLKMMVHTDKGDAAAQAAGWIEEKLG